MKNSYFFAGVLVLMFTFAFDNPAPPVEKDDAAPFAFRSDYLHPVLNCDLEARFELQFANLVGDVNRIDVHHNEFNGHYYTVYGENAAGDVLIEHFKTTAEEVASETYDYIQLSSRTINASRTCREVTTFPFPGNFCDVNNPGPICGIVWGQWGCVLF